MGFWSRRRWKKMLQGCDLELTAAFLNQQFANSVVPKELTTLLEQFVDEPNERNAVALLDFDSEFLMHFEEAKPGGLLARISEHEQL